MRLSILGSGDARQVPVYNCACLACERARKQPEFRRGPCCALIEHADQRWLLDSGLPDLPERFPPGSLSGILQTHYHADHAQGLLHLRWGVDTRIAVHGPDDPEGLADLYKHPGILDFSQPFSAFEQRRFGTLTVTALPLNHSRPTFGYLLQSPDRTIAYLTDTLGLPPTTQEYLEALRLDLLVLDCSLKPQTVRPRNHNDLPAALAIIDSLNVQHSVLTHISHSFDCWLLEHPDALTNDQSVARDGLTL